MKASYIQPRMLRAVLASAALIATDLRDAYLYRADLSRITGKTAAEIKAVAITDATTKF